MLFKRIIIGLIVSALGVVLLKGARKMVQWFGNIPTLEQYLGGGGTYLFYKIAAALLFIGGLFYAFNIFEKIFAR